MNRPAVNYCSLYVALTSALICLYSTGHAALPDLKITTEDSGMYFVGAQEISDTIGTTLVDVTDKIAAGEVSLSVGGSQIPYTPANLNTGLYFYGEALDSIYTDKNVFRLKWISGLQMKQTNTLPAAPAAAGTFTGTSHFEKGYWSASTYSASPESDHWYWSLIMAGDAVYGTALHTNLLSGVSATTNQAVITINLQSANTSGTTNEHHAIVMINGTPVGGTNWTGITPIAFSLGFSQQILSNGNNTVSITGLLDSGVPYSMFYVDSMDMTFTRDMMAVSNQITFKPGTAAATTASGFSSPAIVLSDISNPMDPVIIMGSSIAQTGSVYSIGFIPANTSATFVAFAQGYHPASLSVIPSSDIRSTAINAEYIVIAPSEFSVAAQNLINFRQTKRIKAKLINIDDVYNEFGNGLPTAQAIKDFLSFAFSSWATPPKYVVLAGSGTYDYKDFKGFDECIIPAKLVNVPTGVYASDGWFTDFNDDYLPEIAIGRLPAMTAVELDRMIQRIIQFENSPYDIWQDKVILAADNSDHGGTFSKSSDDIANIIPLNFDRAKIHMTPDNGAESHSNLMAHINEGAVFLNYCGHSGIDTLSDNGLLAADDIALLSNSNRLPIVTSFSCIMGRFEIPGTDCLAENLLLTPTGGAVAVWAPTGQARDDISGILAKLMYAKVFLQNERILGTAILKAMQDYAQMNNGKHLMYIYNLLGDPGMMIRGVSSISDDPYSPINESMVNWKDDYYAPAEINDLSISGDFSDSDGDGIVNIAEYIFAHNPKIKDSEADIFETKKESTPEVHDIMVAYKRNKWATGINQHVYVSSDLNNWQDAEPYVVKQTTKDDGNDRTVTIKKYIKTPDSSRTWFVKLKIYKGE